MDTASPRGEEFRQDLRAPGARNVEARRLLGASELAPLTTLSTPRSLLAIAQTAGLIAVSMALAEITWPSPWMVLSVLVIGVAQHAVFILVRAAARQDRWLVVAFHLAAPLLALALGGGQGLLMYAVLWLLPLLTVLQPILRLRAICEHGAVSDLSSPLTAARCNRTSGSLANWLGRALLFPHHVNFHLEHHLYPAVPHYHLPRLHRLLRDKGALDAAEVRDLAETWTLIFAPRRPRDVRHA